MLKLIRCEFQKLKRRKFIAMSMGAAFLFPIPVVFLGIRQEQPFYMLFRMVFMFGEMLFLPCVLGILSTMIFLPEKENGVLKNILTIPISKAKIFFAKCVTLVILSIIYCLLELSISIVASGFVGEDLQVTSFIWFSILSGIFMFAASLPIIVFVAAFGKNFTISNIVSFIYSVVCFALAYICLGQGGETLLKTKIAVLPVVIVFKWYLGYFPLESRLLKYVPYAISTTGIMIYMVSFSLIMLLLGAIIYEKMEV